ncbi:MAG: translation initiation factor Sui1 [Chitinivibrionales bacterium]|nr:translation initiation factor Sui1 [Chitinivibrionales bacterium]
MTSELVYSTETGRICPSCGKPAQHCICSRKKGVAQSKGDGRVRVSLEKKGRKGKGVTIITGLPLNSDEMKALTKELKRGLGTGGTVKSTHIEIQGDHRDALVEELNKRGYKAKRSGG